MDDLIKRARKELPALREAYELAISCRVLKELPQFLEELADALEAERKARADLERWADQARPVVEAVRDHLSLDDIQKGILRESAAHLDAKAAIDSAMPGEVGEIQRKVTGIRALPWESQANALLVDLETLLAIVQRLSVDLTTARAEVERQTRIAAENAQASQICAAGWDRASAEVERLKSEKTALAAENARLVNEHAAAMSRAEVLAEGVRRYRLGILQAVDEWEFLNGHMVSK